MIDPVKRFLLAVLRVPPEPHPPTGSPASTTIFRASKNYFYYNLFGWGLKQIAALLGVAVFLMFTLALEVGSQVPWRSIPLPRVVGEAFDAVEADEDAVDVGEQVWWWFNTRLWRVIETLGLVFFIVQIPVTYAMVRLDYEMRWYIVTDRSLRIREGITSIREMTMTFANIQHLNIRQGPIQRLLTISDLRVRTAGGGSSDKDDEDEKKGAGSMHIGYLRGVDQAEKIRDTILTRLKRFRDAGLGDPDDREIVPEAPTPAVGGDALAAARDLLGEARALRESLSRSS